MNDFAKMESECDDSFLKVRECYHVWTPENFPLICSCDQDFKIMMNIFGLAAALFPELKIITFEIMSNHLHALIVGDRIAIKNWFNLLKEMISTNFKFKNIDWSAFTPGANKIESLEELRNIIVYINRNGFLVRPEYSPFTYPWGANSLFFNDVAMKYSLMGAKEMPVKERRKYSHSHLTDNIRGVLSNFGYLQPAAYCDIKLGESMFRNASHYLNKLTKNIESQKDIAAKLCERIFYNDDELFSIVCSMSQKQYGASPAEVNPSAKVQLAKTMHFEYNASAKQIQRILRLPQDVVRSLFPNLP